MDSLADELETQTDWLEQCPRVRVLQDLDAAVPDRPYEGTVEVYESREQRELQLCLDLYDQEGSYKVEAQEVDGHYDDSFRRYTIPDTLILLSSLLHRYMGTWEIDLDTDHWPACRVELTQHHLTHRSPHRKTSTVLYRGSYFDCLEHVRERVDPDGLPTDIDLDIKGDLPPKHTVEEPPQEPEWVRANGNVEAEDGEVMPF